MFKKISPKEKERGFKFAIIFSFCIWVAMFLLIIKLLSPEYQLSAHIHHPLILSNCILLSIWIVDIVAFKMRKQFKSETLLSILGSITFAFSALVLMIWLFVWVR